MDDSDRRLQMCEHFISQFKADPGLCNIIWSDKESFKLHGMINQHNSVICVTENTLFIYDKQLKPGITFLALNSDGLLGLYFFYETVTRDN